VRQVGQLPRISQEYVLSGEDDRCVWLTTLLSSGADCSEIGSLNFLETPASVQTCREIP